MTQNVDISGFAVATKTSREHRLVPSRTFVSVLFMCLSAASFFAFCSPSCLAQAASPYVPSVVVSSVGPLAVPRLVAPTGSETNLAYPTDVAVDACGNIYTVDIGPSFSSGTTEDTLTKVPVNGGPAVVVENVGEYYFGHLGQDPTRKNLILGQPYHTGGSLIPLENCVPRPSLAQHFGGGTGPLFYYYNPDYLVADFLGNTYISTQGTCCVTGLYYLLREGSVSSDNENNGNILLSDQPAEIRSIAVDQNQNIYFISNYVLYELQAFGDGNYATTPIVFSSEYNYPLGVSVDVVGNLYVVDDEYSPYLLDGFTQTIHEIPNETTSPGFAALNPADQFIVATGIAPFISVAIDAHGDIYYPGPVYISAGTYFGSIDKLSLGKADFGTEAVGQTVTRIINFQFNSPVTPSAIRLPKGAFATEPGDAGSVPCTAGMTYAPSQNNYCRVTATFKPEKPGPQSSTVVLEDASGNAIATAFLEGVGAADTVPVGTTTTISANPGSDLTAGEFITLTAFITPDSGPVVPTTGTVTFADPAGGDITLPVIGGTATYYGFVPRAGTYSVYAKYNGGYGFAASKSATITRTVTAPPS